MRGAALFIAGAVAGLALQLALAQKNQGVVGINHVGVNVPDIDEAVAYYTETMGFPEAFRMVDDAGNALMVFVQVSQNTFIELQAANAQRLPGISHFGLEVNDIAAAIEMFEARGLTIAEPRGSSPGVILTGIDAPNDVRIELLQFPPEPPHGQYPR